MRSVLGSDPFVMSCVVIIGISAAILVILIVALGARSGPEEMRSAPRPDDKGTPPNR